MAACNICVSSAGRDIKTEALQQVAGSSSSTAWFEAQQFGTALNRQLFTLQSKLMREAAKAFLASARCSNSKEARPQYVLGLARSGGGWFFEEALWMAVYGTSCHISSSSSWRQQQHERARQQREQAHRQQQREEARQQRREQARRQQDERARQQHRQQQFQQARPAAAAELSAPEPDVRSMSEAELRAFLETVSSRQKFSDFTVVFLRHSMPAQYEDTRSSRCSPSVRHSRCRAAAAVRQGRGNLHLFCIIRQPMYHVLAKVSAAPAP